MTEYVRSLITTPENELNGEEMYKKLKHEDVIDYINNISFERLVGFMSGGQYDYYYQYIKDNETRVNCYLAVNKNHMIDYDFKRVLCGLESDTLKAKYVKQLDHTLYTSDVICSIKDERLRVSLVDLVTSSYDKEQIFKSIKDDAVLLDYYSTCNENMKLEVITCLKEDENKMSKLNDFKVKDQVSIIESLKSIDYKKQYAILPAYSKYRSKLIAGIDDRDFIVEYFKINTNEKFRKNLIKRIYKDDLKCELISLAGHSTYFDTLATNYEPYKSSVLENIDVSNINYDVDQNITIGVELEACCKEASQYRDIGSIFNDWMIKNDGSVSKGLEISSPVLRFNESSLKQLKYVCDFMEKNGFYIDNTCGGHIHLGFDYFETKEQFNAFLNLYSVLEDVLYVISNREGSKSRVGIISYAKHMDKSVKDTTITSVNLEKISSLGEYAQLALEKQPSRYYGLNMKNIGRVYKNTIEFRMPNGEINFEEVINNIRLFAKLFEATKHLDDPDKKDIYDELVNEHTNSKEKLSLLLDLLFDDEEEKDIYRRRYKINKRVLIFKKH